LQTGGPVGESAEIVEVMGNTSDQGSDGLHFLQLPDLISCVVFISSVKTLTMNSIDRYLMISVNARKWGLIVSLTRFVYFGKFPAGLKKNTRPMFSSIAPSWQRPVRGTCAADQVGHVTGDADGG
jgi:hypothetical protein